MKEIKRSTKIQLLKSGACILVALVMVINAVFLYAEETEGEGTTDPSPSVTQVDSVDTPEEEEKQEPTETSKIEDVPGADVPQADPVPANSDSNLQDTVLVDPEKDINQNEEVEPETEYGLFVDQELISQVYVSEISVGEVSSVSASFSDGNGVPSSSVLVIGGASEGNFAGYGLQGIKAFDISLLNNNEKIAFSGDAEVTINFAQPLFVGMSNVNYVVLHKRNDGDIECLKEMEGSENGISSVTFTTDSFSPYAIGAREKQQETLFVSENETYNSSVTTDLNKLLTKIEIIGATESNGVYQVTPGVSYGVKLKFNEDENGLQFDVDNEMIYKFPEGVSLPNSQTTSGEFDIPFNYGQESCRVHAYYEISGGEVKIRISSDSPDYNKFKGVANAYMNLELQVEFDSNYGNISFGEGVATGGIFVDDSREVTVEKKASHDKANNKVEYVIKVHSKGQNTNVIVEDFLSENSILTFDKNVTYSDGENNGNNRSIIGDNKFTDFTQSENRFSFKIPYMENGEDIYFFYTASVNVGSKGDITTDSTRNTVNVKSDEDKEGASDTKSLEYVISYDNVINKSSEVLETKDKDGKKVVKWEINVNPDRAHNISGWIIKDAIEYNSREIMDYDIESIMVEITDENGTSSSYVEVKLSDDKKSWTYTLPDNIGKAACKITYNTLVDISGKVSDVIVKNYAEANGWGDYEDATVPVDSDSVAGVKKEVVSYSNQEITWGITATIPASGLDACEITDVLPNWYGHYYDTITKADKINITGLENGESFEVSYEEANEDQENNKSISKISKFTIKFYQDNDRKREGLRKSEDGKPRTIYIVFTTKNNQAWINSEHSADDGGATHNNTVILTANKNQSFTDRASVMLKNMEKSLSKKGQRTDYNGQPGYNYLITLKGVSKTDLMDGKLTITDKFDKRLRFLSEEEVGQSWVKVTINGGYYYGQHPILENCISAKQTGEGQLTFTIKDLPLRESGEELLYSEYTIRYWLVAKDKDAIDELDRSLITSGNGKLELQNTASWNGITDTATVDYTGAGGTNDFINKSISDGQDPNNNDEHIAGFYLVVNPKGLKVNDGNPLEVIDTMTNLSFVPGTMIVKADGEEISEYTCNIDKNVMSMTVPDGKKIEITYQAQVVGSGYVEYNNAVSVNGYTKEIGNRWISITSSVSGGGGVGYFTLAKAAYGNANMPLEGAEFELHELINNNWIRRKSGIKTGADGRATVLLDYNEDKCTLQIGHTYRLTETKAPDGYTKADPIEFVYGSGNEDKLYVSSDYPIYIYDKKENFRIIKKDASGDKKVLSGATFTLVGNGERQVVTTDENGVASFAGLLPGEYTLQETKAPDGYKENSTTYKVIVDNNLKVSSDDLSFDGSTGSWSADVTNEKKTGSLIITKKVSGFTLSEDKVYKFSIKSKDISFEREVDVTVSANNTKGSTLVKDLPLGNYEIKEIGDNLEESGYKWTVSITGAEQSGNTTTATVSINEDEPKEVIYTNDYQQLSDVSIILEGTKVLSGNDHTGKSFSFILSRNDEKAGVTLPAENCVANLTVDESGNGKFEFGEIKFSKADTYTFTVKEVRINEEGKKPILGIDYDDAEYTVTVVVSEDKNNGTYKIDSVTVDSTASESTPAVKSGEKTYTLPTHTREGIDGTATFVNRVEKGSLKITKKVVVKDAKGEEVKDESKWPNDLKNKSYTFTLTDSNKNVYKEDGTIDPDGNAVITLTADGSKTINNLPVDVTYTLVENDAALGDYEWKVTSNGVNVDGIDIADKGTSEVTFTNEYTKIKDINIRLGGTKKLQDGTLTGNEFEFVLSDSQNKEISTAKNSAEGANGIFTFDAIEFDKADTYTFTIKEMTPSSDDDQYAYDRNSYTVEVVVRQKNNAYEYEIKSVKVGNEQLEPNENGIYMLPNKEGETASFVNREKKGDLTISKTVVAPAGSGFDAIAYQFTVYGNGKYYDAQGVGYPDPQLITVTRSSPVTITGLPVGEYTVTEMRPGYDEKVYKWEVTDTGSYSRTINEEDDSVSVSGVSVADGEDTPVLVAFTNTFSKITPASMSLKGTKVLVGGTLGGGQYKFGLSIKNESNEEIIQREAWNTAVDNTGIGSFIFENITFEEAGTYKYDVWEKTPSNDKVTCDTIHYNGTITVSKNIEGSAYEVVAINGEDITNIGNNGVYVYELPKKEEVASFVNSVNKGSIKITKTVAVDNPIGFTQEQYGFTVQDADKKYYDQQGTKYDDEKVVTIGDKGVAIFNNLPVGTYTVSEKTPDITENTGYKWTVIVKDASGESGTQIGTQVAPISVTNGGTAEAAFVNSYQKITGTSIVLQGTKALVDGTLGNGYEFHIEQAVDDKVKLKELPANAVNSGDTFTFGAINFTQEGTYTFIVTEVNKGNSKIEYDLETRYEVNVEVGKNSDGTKYEVKSVTGAKKVGNSKTYNLPEKTINEGTEKEASATFVNREKKGSLSIHKTANTPFNTDQYTYNFTVQDKATSKFYDKDGVAHTDRVTITLKHNETIPINDLPVGEYIVSEEDAHQVDYVWTVSADGTTGTKVKSAVNGVITVEVEDNKSAGVEFTNTYTKISGKPIVLKGTKSLKDGDVTVGLNAGEYSFSIVQVPAEGEETISIPVAVPGVAPNDESGNFTFTAITFDKEGTYYFKVSEVKPQNADEDEGGILYDNTTYDITVTVTENGNGYDIDVNGTVPGDGNVYTITPSDGKTATFENYVKRGSLKIIKTVADNSPESAKNKIYRFRVKGEDQNYYALNGSVDNNAYIYVSATSKEGVLVENLPVGSYTIIEDDSDAKIADYTWSVTATVDGTTTAGKEATVTVPYNDTASVSFENSYTEITGISISLKGTKALIGGTLTSGKYGFEIEVIRGNKENVTLTNSTPPNGVGNENNIGEIDFGSITFNKAGTYRFKISETSKSDKDVKCDETTYTLEVTVNEVNDAYVIEYVAVVKTGEDGQEILENIEGLNQAYELPKQKKTKGETYEASFINEVKQNSLFIKKNVKDDTIGQAFSNVTTYYFNVAKVEGVGDNRTYTYYNQNGEVRDKKEEAKIPVQVGETVEIKNLPEGNYVVTEVKSGYDEGAYKWDVNVTSANATENGAEASISVSLDNPPATAVFTNTFNDIIPVSMNLKGTKTLDGGDISKYDGQFKFILIPSTTSTSWDNVLIGEEPISEKTVPLSLRGNNGEFTFQNITFKRAGEYTFTVREYGTLGEESKIDGIFYDPTEYKVVVTVDNNGTACGVTSVVVYRSNETDGTDITPSGSDREFDLTSGTPSFVNRVMEGSLKITKKVTATEEEAKFQADSYVFTVQDENDKTYNAQGKQEEGATISVTPGTENSITISGLPVGKYKVSEAGNRPDYVWTVTVSDGNNVTVEQIRKGAVQVYVGDKETTNKITEVTFNNAYTKIGDASMTLTGTKDLEGGTDKSGYQFSIKQKPVEGEEAIEVPEDEFSGTDGKFHFQIPFDKAGTYHFEVSEVNTHKPGIEYDEGTKYDITVKVEPDGDEYKIIVFGEAEKDKESNSENAYVITPKNGRDYAFVNRMKKGSLVIKKTVDGAAVTSDRTYDFIVEDELHNRYGQDGSTQDSNAVIKVPANGNPVEVKNLPEGKKYTVTEVTDASNVKIPGYKWLYVSADDVNGDNKEVTVSENNPVSVSFVNHYEKIGGVSINLTGSKAIIGGSLEGNDYEFAIALAEDSEAKSVELPNPAIVKNNEKGDINFNNILFEGEGNYKFVVSEETKSTPQISCDTTSYTVEVKVAEKGDAYVIESVKINNQTQPDNQTTYALPPKTVDEETASFINVVKRNSLFIEKIEKYVGTDGNVTYGKNTYYFIVEDESGNRYDQYGNTTNPKAEIPVQAGTRVEVKSLPAGHRYTVSEVAPGYNTTKYSFKVEGEGGVLVEYGAKPATVTVTNTFTEKTPASMNIKGTKVLKGGKIEDYSGKFKFILTPVGENWDSDKPVEKWNENGEFTFSGLTFMGEGTYTFTVEEAGTGDGIDYDTEKYTVTANVIPDADGYKVNSATASDKNGNNYTLTSDGETWILPTHERNGETATFVNEKKPEEPVPTATPTETPTATPTSTETPTPGATSTPGTTPSATETPGPSATPGTTPGATATPAATPDQTPAPEETPVPDNTPNPVVTPRNNPAPTPRGTVLGARKVKVGGTQAAVLGARRGADFAVLGKRRRPSTGDSMALLIWIITMSVAMGGAITSSTMLSLENGRKRRRRR